MGFDSATTRGGRRGRRWFGDRGEAGDGPGGVGEGGSGLRFVVTGQGCVPGAVFRVRWSRVRERGGERGERVRDGR